METYRTHVLSSQRDFTKLDSFILVVQQVIFMTIL